LPQDGYDQCGGTVWKQIVYANLYDAGLAGTSNGKQKTKVKIMELVPKLIDYALKRMVLEQALGKSGPIGLKSGPLFPLNLRLLFQN
jgi:hypothetical protein